MTVHAMIKATDRASLPRALLGRRRFRNTEFEMAYEIGALVTLNCTAEAAVIVGRLQMVGCIDEYWVQICGADCDAFRVLAEDIH